MDNLHNVLRSIRAETKSRREDRDVFREFLDRIDHDRRRNVPRSAKVEGRAKRAKH